MAILARILRQRRSERDHLLKYSCPAGHPFTMSNTPQREPVPKRMDSSMNAYSEPKPLPGFLTTDRTAEQRCGPGSSGVQVPSLGDTSASGDLATMLAGFAGMVAARHLCVKKEVVLGLIGAGPKAQIQLEALCREFSITKIKVWDPDTELTETFCKKYAGSDISACNPRMTCDCDLLVTTTASEKPVVKARWVHPGTHINAMGTDKPGHQELDSTLVAIARIFVYNREHAIRAGEINMPVAQGFFRPERIAGTLSELVLGKKGRDSGTEITIFDSSGLQPGVLLVPQGK
jgi:hypothetical protein